MLGTCIQAAAPERWLQSLRQGWNLAQFDLKLSASQRRGKWLPRAWRTLARDPAWRPVRWSLGALLGLQLLGLNLLAWQEHLPAPAPSSPSSDVQARMITVIEHRPATTAALLRQGVRHHRPDRVLPVTGLRKGSGRRESNPHHQLGRLRFYH